MNPVYIFWDQGGLFGVSRCVLSKTNKKKEEGDDTDIYTYYQGYMDKQMIIDLIKCFDLHYNCNTKISFEE